MIIQSILVCQDLDSITLGLMEMIFMVKAVTVLVGEQDLVQKRELLVELQKVQLRYQDQANTRLILGAMDQRQVLEHQQGKREV